MEVVNSGIRSHAIYQLQSSLQSLLLQHYVEKEIELRSLAISVSTLKGKAIPKQAWTGLEGSRKLRLPDFKTVGT